MGRVVALDEHRIGVDGITHRWLEPAGESEPASGARVPPVVLIHGIPTSADLWRRVLPALRGTRAMAWEMVGYGASIPEGRGRDISVARQADYLLAWLDGIGIARVVLVGHDLGAGVAQRAAVLRPDLCAGLVLTNGVAHEAWPVWPMALTRRLHALIRRVPDVVLGPVFRGVISRMHAPREIGVESARIHWSHYRRHGAGPALAHQARSLDAGDTMEIVEDVRRLDTPARVVWGDADPFLPMTLARRLAADLGTEVRPIPGARHFTPEDRPGPIIATIRDLTGLR